MTASAPRIVALEEHYADPELLAEFGAEDLPPPPLRAQLLDLAEGRLRAMDEAGIELQVLSHTAPATQKMEAAAAVRLARRANDRLQRVVEAHPTRFAAFAILPTPDPEAAAAELERAVRGHGFKGAIVHGLTNGAFLDERRFWPILAAAEALEVPIYLHPAQPSPAVTAAYYQDYAADFPALLRAGWGFTVEAATQAIRLVLSGALEAHPRLRLILGHMGEALPFLLWRTDQALSRAGNRLLAFREAFARHFWVTTSGNFSTPALLCTMLELGLDRVLFSVDWPFVDNRAGVDWLRAAPLSEADRAKVFAGNACRLLGLG
ncbi:MAG TPA: amidohydrolase family protein [Crenalkalicoccus sp.]|jgi:2,3-dihydroxybenzoate decarboxylase|nr:amidohydrolase family protein [Crenalkalicoccus sp.]